MAIQTYRLAAFDEGRGVWEVDWDDNSLILRTVRCINNSAFPSRLTATADATGRTGSLLAPAGQTTSQNLPTGAQNKLDISFNATKNRIDGVNYQVSWPA